MSDPLAQVVGLLQPSAAFSKIVTGSGAWRVRRSETGRAFYCAVLDGRCRLAVKDGDTVTLEKGDFALIPAAYDFATSSVDPVLPEGEETVPVELRPGAFHFGRSDEPPDIRVLVGYGAFRSTDADLLVSLLPRLVHVRGDARLTILLQLLDEESRALRPARDIILARLIEVLLIEALRSTAGPTAPPGLLRGLADERVAIALRRIHERPTDAWSVAQLAREAALSRSVFFDRFRRVVGIAPMEYLLQWRMALAKDLLRHTGEAVAEIAERVGYGSASAFSTAFARHVGVPPTVYARQRPVE